MKPTLQGTRFRLTETSVDRLPATEREVAFVGRSNVGKSSLLCAICNNWKLARVSKTPGRTRGINLFEVHDGRTIVDLPGYGYAEAAERQRAYWPEMIGRYLSERPPLVKVFVAVDAEIGPSVIDERMVAWLREKGIPFRIVANKSDRVRASVRHTRRTNLNEKFGLKDGEAF